MSRRPRQPEGCTPDCAYRSLYEGTQASLLSMTAKQTANLERVQKVRGSIIAAMKSHHPRLFADLEGEIGDQMRNCDDRVLTLAVEQMFERTRTPVVDLSALRAALEGHGFALPAEDDPDLWASLMAGQRPTSAGVEEPQADPLAATVTARPADDRFPTMPGAPRTFDVDDAGAEPAPPFEANPLPGPYGPPPVAEAPPEDVDDFFGADAPHDPPDGFPDFDMADAEPQPGDFDDMFDLPADDQAAPPAPTPEAADDLSDMFTDTPAPPAPEPDSVDDLLDMFATGPDPQPSPDVDDLSDMFADPPAPPAPRPAAPEASDVDDLSDMFADPPPPPVEAAPKPRPKPAAQTLLRPQLTGLPPAGKPAAARPKRARAVSATRPSPPAPQVDMSVAEKREMNTLLTLPRPVFLSDVADILGAARADQWFAHVKSNRDSGLRFLSSKARWSSGPLIIPSAEARSPLQQADTSGWSDMLDAYRGSHLYAAGQLMRKLGTDTISTEVQSCAFAMSVRGDASVYGLIAAVGDDFASGSVMVEQVGALVGLLNKSRLDHILIVTTSGQQKVLDALTRTAAEQSRAWKPKVPLRVGFSHQVGSGSPTSEVFTPRG